jgi:WD40 repeat protein
MYSAAYSPNGHTVVSGSADKTLKLWDAATGKLIRTFECEKQSARFGSRGEDYALASRLP